MTQEQSTQKKPGQEQLSEEIRKRAEAIYFQRVAAGKKDQGDALSDWLKAEREVRGKYK